MKRTSITIAIIFASLGYMFKKLELGLRTTSPLTSIQINGSYRF